MIGDPMADIGPSSAGGAGQPSPDGAADSAATKEVVDPLVLQLNMQRIDHIHSVMGVASGCVAGILGLTGLRGFACFFFLHALVTLSIWLVKMKGNLRKFTRQSAFGFYTFSIQPCLLSFTLFWTLFYGLVYLY